MCAALKEIMKEDFYEAETKGEAKGAEKMARLLNRLYEDGRKDEAQRVGTDPVLREKLYADYQIVTP